MNINDAEEWMSAVLHNYNLEPDEYAALREIRDFFILLIERDDAGKMTLDELRNSL
jgi:hypothetical protein